MSKTIVFFGNERLATGVNTECHTLNMLISQGYSIPMVITNYSSAMSRTSRTLEIKELAEENSIPVFMPDKLYEIKDKIQSCKADIGVLVAYGKIVPQSIINVFPQGIVNIHPSDLPLHRGPTPIESVLIEGPKKTSVSLMKLAQEMDSGPVYAKEDVYLTGKETKQQLSNVMLEKGAELLKEHLPRIAEGAMDPLPQDSSKATYDKLISKEDGLVDWRKSAEQLEREFRAYANWPKSYTKLAGKDIVIIEAKVVNDSGDPGKAVVKDRDLVVFCGDKALAITKLKPAGKNEMTGQAFVAGLRAEL